MDITLKAQKILWGRAANRCSFSDCRIELTIETDGDSDPNSIGENCHIHSRSPNGPRGNGGLSDSELASYSNLILLCRNHHKIIDGDPDSYPVLKLRNIKSEHENWVESNLNYDHDRQKDQEQLAKIVDRWCCLAAVDEWTAWTSSLLSFGQPKILEIRLNDLKKLENFLLSAIWPKSFSFLELSFKNFLHVLNDFIFLFESRRESKISGPYIFTEKFYKIDRYDQSLYFRLVNEYEYHVDLIQDLVLELNRSANLIISILRRNMFPLFRGDQGHLIVEYGPVEDLSFRKIKPLYDINVENKLLIYPGIEQFKKDRFNRDFVFGQLND